MAYLLLVLKVYCVSVDLYVWSEKTLLWSQVIVSMPGFPLLSGCASTSSLLMALMIKTIEKVA